MVAAPAAPIRFGRYEVERELGKGAMGVVYLARDPVIGRQVAIKTFAALGLADELEERRAHRRFIREAESAGALSHPNIVTVYDVVDEGPRGSSFLAMEYVEGPNLAQWLARRRVVVFDEVLAILAQAADGIDYAHANGVLHRDIKPANLLLAAGGRVKIADFGIARRSGSHLTQEPEVFGTPSYMPPEVMEGRDPDARSDLYALGVVAYELLTGHAAFAAPTLAGVVLKVVRGELVPAESLVAELPAGTSAVLARALDRDPGRRYPTAGAFVAGLVAVMAGAPVAASPGVGAPLQGPTRRLATPPLAGRRRWRRAASRWGLLNALLLGLFLGARVWLASSARPLTSDPGERARSQYFEALGLGLDLRAAGELAPAAAQFARAQALAPQGAGAARLRAETEQAARDAELGRRREAVDAALAAKDYPAALAAARRLLELGPGEAETRELLLAVEQGLAAPAARPTPGRPQSKPVAPESRAPVEPASAAPPAPAVFWTTLEIAFATELIDGVLTIYAGDEQILRMPFDEFRRDAAANAAGALVRFLPARPTTLRVYTTVARKPARLAVVDADFAGTGRRRLQIRLADETWLRATLE